MASANARLSLEDYNTSPQQMLPSYYFFVVQNEGCRREEVEGREMKDTLPMVLLNPSIVFLPSRYTDYNSSSFLRVLYWCVMKKII